MKSSAPIFALVVWLASFLPAIAAPSTEQGTAVQQQDQADLVVDFWHWDSLSIVKPTQNKPTQSPLTKAEFLSKLAAQKIGRDFVVVVLDKREAPEGRLVSIDSIVGDFHRLGFRRVVIQQATGRTTPPVLRDSKKEANQTLEPTAPSGRGSS